MVIFGSSGDLTNVCWIPALYNLAKAADLPTNCADGGRPHRRSHEEFRAYLAEGVRSFVLPTPGPAGDGALMPRGLGISGRAGMNHLKGDVTDPAMYDNLGQALKGMRRRMALPQCRFSISPLRASLFAPVVERLAAAGLTREEDSIWRRGHYRKAIRPCRIGTGARRVGVVRGSDLTG